MSEPETVASKVVFDTDPGIDDAMALLYLNACEGLELLGVTSTLGNATIDECTTNALFLCEKFNVPAPVYRGTERCINGEQPERYAYFVHGSNGLGEYPVSLQQKQPEEQRADQFLLEVTRNHPGEITILAVGRLTNLAMALEADDSFAERVGQVVMMGGAVHHPGNVNEWSEANVFGDPEAAEIVFRSGIPLTMVGLDVTMQTRMSHDYVDQLCQDCPVIADFLKQVTSVYAGFYKRERNFDAFPVHDSSAVAFADQPATFVTERGYLNCLTDGEQRGRTLFEPDLSGPHQVCLGVNADLLLDRYHKVMKTTYGR